MWAPRLTPGKVQRDLKASYSRHETPTLVYYKVKIHNKEEEAFKLRPKGLSQVNYLYVVKICKV